MSRGVLSSVTSSPTPALCIYMYSSSSCSFSIVVSKPLSFFSHGEQFGGTFFFFFGIERISKYSKHQLIYFLLRALLLLYKEETVWNIKWRESLSQLLFFQRRLADPSRPPTRAKQIIKKTEQKIPEFCGLLLLCQPGKFRHSFHLISAYVPTKILPRNLLWGQK